MQASYPSEDLKEYQRLIQLLGSLSNLFSESSSPYIHYRVAENLYCRTFRAENLSRGDISFDAKLSEKGVGIKTFLKRGASQFEKVAEFNALSPEIRKLAHAEEIIRFIAEARNARIDFAERTCNTQSAVYHCITRAENLIEVFETEYPAIHLDRLKVLRQSASGIQFTDGSNVYSFNNSKSTLFKEFHNKAELSIPVVIQKDPFTLLDELIIGRIVAGAEKAPARDYVILPLYSPSEKKSGREPVPSRSQLNQWNASGRPRSLGEVYISIPRVVHHLKPEFFPSREQTFSLTVPSGEVLSAKVCQAGDKALMTNPNDALAEWLLRKTLMLKEGEILTYSKLKSLGVDSVIISKIDSASYSINFCELDSYEKFVNSISGTPF